MNKSLVDMGTEQAFLGSILVDDTLKFKLDEVDEDCFGDEINRCIYNAMKSLKIDNKRIDIVSVKSKLDDDKCNVDISYLSGITIYGQDYAIDTYVDILKEKSMRRSIIRSCETLFKSISIGKDLDASIYNFESNMKSLINSSDYKDDDIVSISESLLSLLEGEDKSKISFGMRILDDTIGGLFKGELTTIAARSGVGKTALALQIMLNIVKQNKKVLFITREMSKEQILMRNITKKTGINTNKMKSKDIDEDEWKLIINSLTELNSGNLIYINDKISTVSMIRKRIREIKPDVLIVDYVQLLTPSSNMNNREREVASISRELKSITLDFEISVIQLSQLNDEMKDMRPWGERPMRESKAIYHDSNNVIYIHEPIGSEFDEAVEVIGQSKSSVKKAKERGIRLVDIIVAKCRDGEKKYRHCSYNGNRLHFQEIVY